MPDTLREVADGSSRDLSSTVAGSESERGRERKREARARAEEGHTATMMAQRDELLKSIWHAFTALDLDRSGKVSKSQLKVKKLSGCLPETFPPGT